MNSVIMHRYWGSPGGGQLVCSATFKVLKDYGLNPAISGTFRFDWSKYKEWFGIDMSDAKVFTFNFDLKAFGIMSRAIVWMPAKKAIRETKAELLFTDEPTYKPLLKSYPDLNIIEYVHFPLETYFHKSLRQLGFNYFDDPYLYRRYSKFPFNFYWQLYTIITKRYMRNNPFSATKAVLTNSMWTNQIIRQVYGESALVVNPPLPPSVSISTNPAPFDERKRFVVMLGRFSEEKGYDWVLEALALMLKRDGIRLAIIGGATTPVQQAYVKSILDKAGKLGLKISNDFEVLEPADICILNNLPREKVNAIMDNARVFLHATINEHWGIAITEAMARGLPVVVHRSGGAWSDLARYGEDGLGYGDADEAREAINSLMNDNDKWKFYSAKSISRVKDLELPNFASSLAYIIRKIS